MDEARYISFYSPNLESKKEIKKENNFNYRWKKY